MSDLPMNLAEAIVSLKQAQDAVLEFYRTKNNSYQSTPEGKKEIIRLRWRLDEKLTSLATFILKDFGDEAEALIRGRREPSEERIDRGDYWDFQ